MTYAPILITVYNRLSHLQNCVQSILDNNLSSETELFIASDAAYREEDKQIVEEVRSYVSSIKGFKKVNLLANEENMGGRKSSLQARNHVFSKFDRLILMEDDVTVSPYFLDYMNLALEKYKDYPNVFSVTGYQHPYKIYKSYPWDVFFMPAFHAWGVGMWKEKESKFTDEFFFSSEEFIAKHKEKLKDFKKLTYAGYRILLRDLNGEIFAGDSRRAFYQLCNNMASVIPVKTLTKSNGHDGSGMHCEYDHVLQNQKIDLEKKDYKLPDEVFIDPKIFRKRKLFYSPFWKKIKVTIRLYYKYRHKLLQKK